MLFSTPIHQHPDLLRALIFFSMCAVSLSLSENRSSEAGLFCGASQMAEGTLTPNFVEMMAELSLGVIFHEWGSAFVVESKPEIYGFAQCHRDLSLPDCQLCYAKSRAMLCRCLPAASARIYLDGCYLRYDNYSFFYEALDPENDAVGCEGIFSKFPAKGMAEKFVKRVEEVLRNVTESAVLGGGFAVAETVGEARAYALAQCWSTVQGEPCRQCLDHARSVLSGCAPSLGGRAMYAGCYMRYSAVKFFDHSLLLPIDNTRASLDGIIAAIIVALVFVLVIFGAYLGHVKFQKARKEHNTLVPISPALIKSHLRFEYEVLERATNCFDASTKLGQGGAGSVYRGTLPDGKVVAVKRLQFNTKHGRQWTDGFFNEVNLIGGIKHKNLVRLFGCSINGNESLLIYEYVPNKALGQFLFGKNKAQILKWQHRYHIILGIAEGLAYLHGGSEAKIIHRDIKCSNILLDENLTPKIADFGLAHCFTPSKSHITTVIAGTLGYMAPEYLVRGQLTEKADVYAFGVLILEIVTGRKNSIYSKGAGSILHTAWKHYRLRDLAQSVDPGLEGDFPKQQAMTVLQIGLLCTQPSGALRPYMRDVVQMLANEENSVPPPQQPPYLNASLLGTDDSIKSSSTSTLALS